MKLLKKLCVLLLSISIVTPLIPCAAGAEGEQTAKSISNAYMEFSVNEDTGFFGIKTLEGHPQKTMDNNMNLLYDGDSIETSFTTVRIDGKDYVFGQDYGLFGVVSKRAKSTVDAVNNTITTVWEIMDITVTQTAQLSRTENTAHTGNVYLSYDVDNTSDRAHDIGIRVMLDNSLGEIDSPVVMVQNELAPLSKETEFISNNRDPGSNVRFVDSYEQPSKEAFIELDDIQSMRDPDRLIIGHWYSLASTKWQYTPNTDLSFDTGFNDYGVADTASAIYWDEKTCEPGMLSRVSVTYGVGEFSDSYGNSKFNASLDIDGTLEYDSASGGYKDDTVTANIKIYNNVDGSVDLQNANIRLTADDGLTFIVDADGQEYELEEYNADLGFIAAGSVLDYKVKLRADVQTELKSLKVGMVVTGNSDKNIVTMNKYIIAPAAETVFSPVSVARIYSDKYHIKGQRVALVNGSFPSELLKDKTKWKAAWVNTDNPNLRYEIDSDFTEVSSDTEIQLMNSCDMVEGNYKLELAFFEDYKQLIGDSYTSDAFISIVNDPSLASPDYGILCVQRSGTGHNSKYSIKAFKNETQFTDYKKTAKLNGIDDIPLVLRGSFTSSKDENTQTVTKYTATSEYTINNIVQGAVGDKVECQNPQKDGSGNIKNDGVRIGGEQGVSTGSGILLAEDGSEWNISFFTGTEHSLAKENIKVDIDGVMGGVMDVIGGTVKFKYGVFVHHERLGDCINFGGTLTLAGYRKEGVPDSLNYSQTNVNKIEGVDRVTMQQSGMAKLTGSSLYATAEITNCYVNNDGLAGMDTSFMIGIGAANVVSGVRTGRLQLQVDIDTINRKYGGSFMFPIPGGQGTVSAGIEFAVLDMKYCPLVIDDISMTVIIPPTMPIPVVPGFVGLTQLGVSWHDMADLVSIASSPEEAVAIISSSMAGVQGSIGLLVVQLINCIGTVDIGVSHWSVAVTGTIPYVPGISSTLSGTVKMTYPYTDPVTNADMPVSVTIVAGITQNVYNIIVGKGTLRFQYIDGYNIGPIENDSNTYFGVDLFGGLYMPQQVPVVGGMELLGATGLIDTLGVSASAYLFGIEIGCSYAWDDGEFTWVLPYSVDGAAPEFDESKVELTNAVFVPVEILSNSDISLMSTNNKISAKITTQEERANIIAFEYSGANPDYDGLTLKIDGKNYPLKKATAQSGYVDGNCFIVKSDAGNGKVLVGIKDIDPGEHTVEISSKNEGTRFTWVTARGFKSTARLESVKVNSDGTVTVKADGSLKNSEIILCYTDSNDAYDDMITQSSTDENGNRTIDIYKMIDGKKVSRDDIMAGIKEYEVCDKVIEEDTDTVTLIPETDENIGSDDYYIMAKLVSPYKGVSRMYTDNTFKYVNENEPVTVKSASVSDAGNGVIELSIENTDEYSGCSISLYNETDGKYVFEDDMYGVRDTLKFRVDGGKTYHAEIKTIKNTEDGKVYVSSKKFITNSAEIHKPSEFSTKIEMLTEGVKSEYTLPNGNTKPTEYISSSKVLFKVHTDEVATGCFLYDGYEMAEYKDAAQDFTLDADFEDGNHTIQFKAINSVGDESLSEIIDFTIDTTAPQLMLEQSYIKTENGKITIKGTALNTKSIELEGQTYTPDNNGSFEITVPAEVSDTVKKYTVKAIGNAGQLSETAVYAINGDYKPVDKIELMANGEAVNSISIKPGDTVDLSLVGYSDGEIQSVSHAASDIRVVNGNNSAAIDADGKIKGLAAGTAYVKAQYLLGSLVSQDTEKYNKLEDMIEVNVMNKVSNVIASIPDGARIRKGTELTLSGDGDIYYTLDGTAPTNESNLYTEPIIINKDTTVKAICIKDGFIDSDIITVSYKIKTSGGTGGSSSSTPEPETSIPPITTSQSGQAVDYGTAVTLDYDGEGKIYYTTDGSTPNKNSAEYTEPILITADTVIKAVVWQEGDIYGEVQSFSYTVNGCMIKLRADVEKSELFSGYPEGTFMPDNTITRAETAVILRRASEMYGYNVNDNLFNDVDMWAKDYINELAAAEVIKGYGDGSFRPDNSVTRAEFVTMLMRIIGENGNSSAFDDTKEHWARTYIAKASEYGYIKGYPDGTFRPDAQITRAEAAVVMSKVFGFPEDGEISRFSDVTSEHWAFGYIADK